MTAAVTCRCPGLAAEIRRVKARVRGDTLDRLHQRVAAAGSPRCSSIMTEDQNVPTGLAMPLPMMSKAEPWIGSNIDG